MILFCDVSTLLVLLLPWDRLEWVVIEWEVDECFANAWFTAGIAVNPTSIRIPATAMDTIIDVILGLFTICYKKRL